MDKEICCPLCTNSNLEITIFNICNYYICKNCKLGFVNDIGNESIFYKDYYTKKRIYEQELNDFRIIQYDIDANHLLSHLNKGNLLDVGCSNGGFISSILNKGNCEFDVLNGLDIDTTALNVAKKQIKKEKINFIETELKDLNNNVTYDAIVFRGTLQYLGKTLIQSFEKIKQIISKNGMIFIYAQQNSDSFIFKIKGENWNLFNPQEHKLFFNENAVKFLCQKFNFEIVDLTYPYTDTVYCNIEKNYKDVIEIISNPSENKDLHPAFWGNMIQIVLKNKQ